MVCHRLLGSRCDPFFFEAKGSSGFLRAGMLNPRHSLCRLMIERLWGAMRLFRSLGIRFVPDLYRVALRDGGLCFDFERIARFAVHGMASSVWRGGGRILCHICLPRLGGIARRTWSLQTVHKACLRGPGPELSPDSQKMSGCNVPARKKIAT